MKKYIYINIYLILAVCFLSRIVASLYFADTTIDNEWGKLVHNLYTMGTLGINVFDGTSVNHAYAELSEKVIPSIFMPPLYAYFIYIIKLFSHELFDLVKIVILIQIFASTLSTYIFFKILKNFFDNKLSLLMSIIFCLFPINILGAVQISSINLQIFLLLFYLYFFIEFIKINSNYNLAFFSIFASSLLLIRGEFLLFYFLSLVYFLYPLKIRLNKILISFCLTIILISPYLIRNYNIFGTPVLTKSFGYNLLKGNNPEATAEGNGYFIETTFKKSKLPIKIDNQYELNLDNFYKIKAIEFIKDEPLKYIKLYLLKIISLIFIDTNSTYPNYYNAAHIIPKIIVSVFALLGSIISVKRKGFFQYISVFYIGSILLFSLFFILPRYSVMLLPIQLLLSANLIYFFTKKNKLSSI